MTVARRTAELCYSAQLIEPYIRVLLALPTLPQFLRDAIVNAPSEDRVPILAAQQRLRAIIQIIGDEDLGLKAARATEVGHYEVLEHVITSAPTWREGLSLLFRYSRLVNDAADFRLEVHDDKAHLILGSTVTLDRPEADFSTAALFVSGARWITPAPPELEVWFKHSAPADTREYEITFGQVPVRFAQPFDGMVFDAAHLETELASDPRLHATLRARADELLAKLPVLGVLTGKVRCHILDTMPDGSVSAERVASLLHMSRRTLTRHLADEGTSFKALLDQTREHSARHYLQTTNLSAEDIAFLLGFSESAPFVRAFKRWTKRTPIEHRRWHRSR